MELRVVQASRKAIKIEKKLGLIETLKADNLFIFFFELSLGLLIKNCPIKSEVCRSFFFSFAEKKKLTENLKSRG